MPDPRWVGEKVDVTTVGTTVLTRRLETKIKKKMTTKKKKIKEKKIITQIKIEVFTKDRAMTTTDPETNP